MSDSTQRRCVGIVLYEDVEVLDFCGPFEVFSVTRLDESKRREERSPFDVALVAQHPGAITTTGGMRVLPHHTFDDCPRLDIVLVPGGWGFQQQLKNAVLLDWLRARAGEAETLAAVCTGAPLLASAGLLDGLTATTHWKWLDWMRNSFPAVPVDYDKHFIQQGRVFTSAGISAGIDMALKVVAHHFGDEVAKATARHMEYPYPDSDARRIRIEGRAARP